MFLLKSFLLKAFTILMPKVSVIVPNYNHARFLERRLESILTQTYQDFELIILDDYSSDNSIEIIEKYRDDIYDQYYYIPMCREGILQIVLLTEKRKREKLKQSLLSRFSIKKEKEYAAYNVCDENGNPTYLVYDLEMTHEFLGKYSLMHPEYGQNPLQYNLIYMSEYRIFHLAPVALQNSNNAPQKHLQSHSQQFLNFHG